MKKVKISKATIDRLPFAEKGKQIDHFDTELKGFGCRVSATAKTYFVLKRLNGRLTRVTLGRHGIKTADQARKDAIDALSDLGKGIDVNREKARAREKGITVAEVLERYFIARQELKPRTVATYRDLFRLYLSDWMRQPIENITKQMVAKRHLEVAKKAGKAAANNVMRTLRAVYNFANELLDDSLPINPVKRLSNTRQWFTIERRQTVVNESDLPKWFAAVNKLENPTIRDYLLLLLFTGARRTETASLAWKDVDMENKTFVLTITKNGKPLHLPMSDYIHQLFVTRQALRENDFVFPGWGESGHLVEPRKQMELVTKQTGITFSVHDMRRTYTSAIDGVVGYYELKRLLNHSLKADDVTAGYVVKNTEKLRPLMQKVTDHILNLVQPKEPGKIILFDRESEKA
ncbi:MAG: integrase family protein [Syntrophorhabdales bacterium]